MNPGATAEWVANLPPEHKEILAIVVNVLMLVFANNEEAADDWMNHPFYLLDDQVPAEMMRTLEGAEEVKDLLCMTRAMQEMGKVPCPIPYTIIGKPS